MRCHWAVLGWVLGLTAHSLCDQDAGPLQGEDLKVFPREWRFAPRCNRVSRFQPVAYRKHFSYTWKREQHKAAHSNISRELKRYKRAGETYFLYSAYIQCIPLVGEAKNQVQDLLWSLRLPRQVNGDLSNITGINITTECTPTANGGNDRICRCFPGYQWNNTLCYINPSCEVRYNSYSLCTCIKWPSTNIGYCQELPTNPGKLSITARPVHLGSNMTIVFNASQELINMKWYLVSCARNQTMEIYNGTQVSLTTTPWGSVLTVLSVSRAWEGKVICLLIGKNFQWEVSQDLSIPLLPVEIDRTPAQIFVQPASFAGLTLQCCVRDAGKRFIGSWGPGSLASDTRLVGGHWCHSLVIRQLNCPGRDCVYQCVFQDGDSPVVQANIPVFVIQIGDRFCPSDYDQAMWNATGAGQQAAIPCPDNKIGSWIRNCSASGKWGKVRKNCTDKALLTLLQETQWLESGLGSPAVELPHLIQRLRTSTTPGHLTSPQDLFTVATCIKTLSRTAMSRGLYLNISTMEDFLAVTSQILDIDYKCLVRTQQASVGPVLLQSIEDVTSLLHLDGESASISHPNVELHGSAMRANTVKDYTLVFNTHPGIQVYINNKTLASLAEKGNITVICMILRNLERLLPLNVIDKFSSFNNVIDSLILTNTIISNFRRIRLAETEMTFGHKDSTHAREKVMSLCVYWNHTMFAGEGGWSPDGCQSSQKGTSTVCRCKDLNSFSILKSTIVRHEHAPVELLSKFGTCTSILCIIVNIILEARAWKVRATSKLSHFCNLTMMNIAWSLLISDLCFFTSFFVAKSHKSKLCVAAAFINHLFYLAMFFWMLCQGLILVHQLFFEFHHLRKRVVLPIMASIGYVCPLAIAVLALGVYYPRNSYVKDGACWLEEESGAMLAFAVPSLTVVMVNMLILMAVAVLKRVRPSVFDAHEDEDQKALQSILKALQIFTPLYGITWLVGLLDIVVEMPEFFEYLFVVLNSFQGVFIFIFSCIMNQKVKDALVKMFRKLLAAFRHLSFANSLRNLLRLFHWTSQRAGLPETLNLGRHHI